MSKTSVTQAEIKNGGDTKLVVSAGTWRKKGYVDIRNYWRSPDGEWHPTKRGVRINQSEAIHISAAINTFVAEARSAEVRSPTPDGSKPAVSRNGHKRSPAETFIRNRVASPSNTSIRPRYLIPGKDHRKTAGKATFGRKGGVITCKSTAYWGEPIHAPLTTEEWAVCSAITQAVQNVGRLINKGDSQSEQIIRPSVLVPPGVYRPNTLKLAA